jgi:MFS family permease
MAEAARREQHYPFTAWNFVVISIDAAFFFAGLAFMDPVVVLPVLIEKLHGSQVTIGLMGAIQRAGWIVPQLLATSFVLHRRRKKPFVLLPVIVSRAPFVPLAISFYLAPPGSKLQALLGALIGVYAVFFFCDGLVGVPWHDIIARTIPPNLRGRFFASINIGSGIFAIVAGAVVRRVLSDPSLPFPHNYGVLFMFVCGCMAMSTIALFFIKEPHGSQISDRQSLLTIVRSVPSTLRRYPALTRLIIAQNMMGVAAVAIPFYAVYANTRLGLPDSVSGLFIWAGIGGMVIASLVWAYSNDRYGPRLVLRGVSLLSIAAPIAAAAIPPLVRALHAQGDMAYWYAATFFLNSAAASGGWMGVTNYVFELAPDDIRPLFLGLSATLSAPVILMPLIGGVLLSFISYQALFAIAAVGAAGGTLYVFRLEQPSQLTSHLAYEPAGPATHGLTYVPESPSLD